MNHKTQDPCIANLHMPLYYAIHPSPWAGNLDRWLVGCVWRGQYRMNDNGNDTHTHLYVNEAPEGPGGASFSMGYLDNKGVRTGIFVASFRSINMTCILPSFFFVSFLGVSVESHSKRGHKGDDDVTLLGYFDAG
jgi:hypothetical protein